MYVFVWQQTERVCWDGGESRCNDDMLDGLVHWNENASKNDRCKSGAAVGVFATGAAEEMKNDSKSLNK